MKKALALVLALVLALSMAVSAFALDLDLIPLKPVVTPGTDLIELNKIVLNDDGATLVVSEGGVYHVVIENAELYKDIAVSGNGIVSAKLVEFDPEVYAPIGETYAVLDEKGNAVETGLTYVEAKAAVKAHNDAHEVSYHKLVCEQTIVVVELVIAENYSASYKEGTLKVTATEKATGKAMSGSWKVVSDVTIFEYEQVKWAAKYGEALVVGDLGYSDYATALNGYGADYNHDALRTVEDARVISTTAFRAIEGKDIVVAADENNYVTIFDVAAGQKGVNFELYGYDKMYDANGAFVGYEFGFFGDQIVKSAFEITLQPGVTYYQLREAFGVKVEEDDIVDFYLLKDGKVAQIITVDFMTVDLAELVEITVKGENTTLGQYELRLAAPVAAEGEENPNTGAESVVGVVAALAVVSVATAAAVSLKK